MTRVLVIGTKNQHKLREIRAILADLGLDLRGLDAYPGASKVIEDGETFEANARKKATQWARELGEAVVADDSGLEVDALGGRPGVYSSRWAGEEGNDAANNARLLAELAGVAEPKRTARYRCVIALATPAGVEFTCAGACEGRMLAEARGTNGFGYDPLFLVPEPGKTFGELPEDLKNRISHRSRALAAARGRLLEWMRG